MCNRLTPCLKGRTEPSFGNFMSIEKPRFTCQTHNVCQGYTLLVHSAFLGPVLKIILRIVLSNSFKLPLY